MTEDQERSEHPTLEVTKFTDLSEGVFWTLSEDACHVVLYDAITNREITNLHSVEKTYTRFPVLSDDGGLEPYLSVVAKFLADSDDPDGKTLTFVGDILQLTYQPDEDEEEQEQEEDENDEDTEDADDADENDDGGDGGDEEGDEEGRGSGKGEEGNESGSGTGEEGEGREGSGKESERAGNERERRGTPHGPGSGGGDDGNYHEGGVKTGRRKLAWEVDYNS